MDTENKGRGAAFVEEDPAKFGTQAANPESSQKPILATIMAEMSELNKSMEKDKVMDLLNRKSSNFINAKLRFYRKVEFGFIKFCYGKKCPAF